MIPLYLIPYLVEIKESKIKKAAEIMGGENTFQTLLFYGEIYRKAGLTPMYMTTENLDSFVVTCPDTFGKPLH